MTASWTNPGSDPTKPWRNTGLHNEILSSWQRLPPGSIQGYSGTEIGGMSLEDRAWELTDLLGSQGVTSLQGMQQVTGPGGTQFDFGGRRVGYAGDYNLDNTFGSKAADYAQMHGDVPRIGWSSRGEGNVHYVARPDAQGNPTIVPEWGSSSDADSVRTAALVAAALAGGAGLAGYGPLSGLAGSGATSGIGTLASTAGGALPSAIAPLGGAAGAATGIGTLAATAGGALPGAIAPLAGSVGSVGSMAGAAGGGLSSGLGRIAGALLDDPLRTVGTGLAVAGALQDPARGLSDPTAGAPSAMDVYNQGRTDRLSDYERQLRDSRVDTVGPGGGQSWTQGPDGRWTLTTTESPEAAALRTSRTNAELDATNARRELLGYGGAALDRGFSMEGATGLRDLGMGSALGTYQPTARSTLGGMQAPAATRSGYSLAPGEQTATPEAMIRDWAAGLDPASLTGASQQALSRILALDPNQFNQQMADAVYGQASRYMDPQFADDQRLMESRLAEQGFVPGTPAYAEAMDNWRMGRERSYADARDRAIELGYSIGGQNFSNSLQALQAAMGGGLDLAQFGLGSDQARFGEALNRAQFSKSVADTNFGQREAGARFGLAQDEANFDREMASSGRALEIANALFGQNQAVDQAGRQAMLDANAVSDTLFGREQAGAVNARANREAEFGERQYADNRTIDWIGQLLSGMPSPGSPNAPTQPNANQPTPNLVGGNPLEALTIDQQNAIAQYNAAIQQGANQQNAFLQLAMALLG